MPTNPSVKELEHKAAELVRAPTPQSKASFESLLGTLEDCSALVELAERFTPHTEVSAPIYERVLRLQPGNTSARAALGWARWLDGEDEEAWNQVREGHRTNPDHPQLLLLEAALVKEPFRRLELYRRVLDVDPENHVAKEQLQALGQAARKR